MSSLEDFLQFLPLESGPLLNTSAAAAAATNTTLLKPTRPSASGVTWLAVPSSSRNGGGGGGLAYRIANGGCELQAIQIVSASSNDNDKNEQKDGMKIVGTTKLGICTSSSTATAVAVHVATSHDGRMVAVAMTDGSLHCYDCTQQPERRQPSQGDDAAAATMMMMMIHFQQRWVLQNVHSSHVSGTMPPSTSSRLAAAVGASAGPVRSLQFSSSDYTLLLVDDGGKGLVLIQADSATTTNAAMITQPLSSSSSSSSQELHVSCASWASTSTTATTATSTTSGAQQRLAVGDSSGKIHLFSYNAEKLQLVEISSLDFPGGKNEEQEEEPSCWSCTHLDWFTPNSLAAGYCRIKIDQDADDDRDDDDEDADDAALHEAELYIFDLNANDLKQPPTCVSSCGDVVPFFAVPKHGRHVFYTAAIATNSNNESHNALPLLLVASNVASDVGIISKDDDKDADGGLVVWTVKDLPEGSKVMAPTDADTDEFTYALGIGVVVANGGATTTSPAVLLASTDGSLSCWQAVHETDPTFFQSSAPSSAAPTRLPSVPVPPSAAAAVETTSPAAAPTTIVTGQPAFSTLAAPTSLFGATPANTLGSMAAAVPLLGTTTTSSSGGAFSFGSPPATAATPGSSVFGMTSMLGPKPIEDTEKTSSGLVFGSPVFAASSASSPTGAGGFAALAAGNTTASTFGSATGLFPSAARTATATAGGFGSTASTASAPSQFNIFAKSSASSELSAMAKPLFGSTSAVAANDETKEQAVGNDDDAKKNPFAAFSNAKLAGAAAAGFSFGGATTAPTTTTGGTGSGFSFASQASTASVSGSGILFSTSSTTTESSSGAVKMDNDASTALAETHDEPVQQQQQQVDDSIEAKNAARAFDLFDAQNTGVVPRDKLEDLLEELGEGFYGDELDEQIALMDPSGSGQELKRTPFINWYVKLSQTSGKKKTKDGNVDDDSSSMDSDERAEREEEAEHCREGFSKFSQDNKTIKVEDFEKLMESFGTTYCADGAHGRAKKKLDRNGEIYLEDFIAWYLEWFFGEDDESDDDDDDEQEDQPSSAQAGDGPPSNASTTATTAGWGNMFTAKPGSWKCDSCMVRNDDADATKCASCETPRPGAAAAAETNVGGNQAAPASAIGPGGFTFGPAAAAATSVAKPPASSIGPGGFTFGGAAATSSTSSTRGPTFAGLAISDSTGNKVEPETASSTGIGNAGFTFASQGMGPSGTAAGVEPSVKPGSGFSFGSPVESQPLSATKGFVFSSSTSGVAQEGSASLETRDEAGQDQSLDSIEAKNAARAFDLFDAQKTGVVPRSKLEDILEELGEGFYGDELDEQIALMDPSGSGQLKRSPFISWYVKLAQTLGSKKVGDDDSSMDSEERAEREEESEKCCECFSKLSQDGNKTIKVEDFEKLIELLGTTYCPEGAHGRAKKNLDTDGVIHLDDFIAWYLEWYFGEDDDEYDEEESSYGSNENQAADKPAPSTAGWGNLFAAKTGSWKCDSCMVRNDDANATKCASCETPRPGATAAVSTTGAGTGDASAQATGSVIGPGGFSFGGAGSKASAIGSAGFSFGGATSFNKTESNFGKIASVKDEGTKSGFGFSSTSPIGGFSFGGTSTAATGTGIPSSSVDTPFSFSSGTTFAASSSSSSTGTGFMFGQPKATTSTSAVESTVAVSSSGYPPMSKMAPKKMDEMPKAPATSSSSYPPLSKLAPTPADKPKTPETSSAYPPLSSKAPSKVDAVAQKPAATSSYPPMSKTALSKVDFAAPKKETTVSSYLPLSTQAPSKIDSATPKQTPATTSAYPPMASTAPSKVDFGVKPATTASSYPPMSRTAPSKGDFGAPKPVATSSHPPKSVKPPSKVDFGAPKPSATSSYPLMSKAAPSKVDLRAQKPAVASTYPPLSKAAPSKVDFGAQKPAVTSAYPPMSIAPPSKVDFGTQKGTTTSMLQVKPASTAPRYGRVSAPGFTKDETLSEFAAEFKSLVSKMQKSLDLVASRQSADQDGELRSSIEDLVHGVKTILSSFGESNASLADCKRTSARLFAKIDEALRKASEAKRLIDDQQSDRGSDFLQLQPLDAASEKLQRAISAHGILFDRYLSLLRDRSLLVEQLCTADAKFALARALVDITPKVKGFDDETKRMTARCMKLSSTGSQFLLSPGKPVSTLTTRQGSRVETHKSTVTRRRLYMNSSSFDQLRSSRVKSFDLDRKLPKSAEKPRPESRLLTAETTRSPARAVGLGVLQQYGGPTASVFSSPEPAHHRSGWDKVSKVDQTRSKQVSFASPRDLREISLDAAARDALSPYGTTPEKVHGAIAIQNRVDTPAVSKRPARPKQSVQDSTKDLNARAKGDGKMMPSSTFSLLPAPTPTPLESSESRQPPQQGASTSSSAGGSSSFPSKASQVSDASTSSFPSKSAAGSQPSSSGLFSSFPSSVTKSSQAQVETKAADTEASTSSMGAAETAKSGSAFGSMSMLGSSLFSPGLESRAGTALAEVQPKSHEEPDYAAILAAFYQTHNPTKVGDAKKMLEKYKGREADMFMKLGKKYGVPSPLEAAKGAPSAAPAPATAPNAAINLSPQPFSFAAAGSSPFSIQKPAMTPSPFSPAAAAPVSSPLFGAAPSTSQPTFGSTAPTFGSSTSSSAGFSAPASAFVGNPSTPAPTFGSTVTSSFPSTPAFGFASTATTQSPFGGGGGSLTTGGPSPFGQQPAPTPTFSGRSPRELLTAFYQQYNASKISDVDKLLAKYQGKEEHMFRQLAKKYNLDPSVFGLPPSPPAASVGFGTPAPSTSLVASPGGFGSPSVLGGGPVFGAASSASPFGANSGGFGQSTGSGGGGGFGSASGTSFSTGPSFGALAHSPGVGGFGSPPVVAPFGAPRR